jgi:hypothetical protein
VKHLFAGRLPRRALLLTLGAAIGAATTDGVVLAAIPDSSGR